MQQCICVYRKYTTVKLYCFCGAHKLHIKQGRPAGGFQKIVHTYKQGAGVNYAGHYSIVWYQDRDMFHIAKLEKCTYTKCSMSMFSFRCRPEGITTTLKLFTASLSLF